MSLTVRFDPENYLVETVITGTVTAEDLLEESVQAIAVAKKNDCTLFLSDHSQTQVDYSAMDVFGLPELYAAEDLGRSARIAVISPASKIGAELTDFHETVCVNRAWTTRTFEDRQEALDWLLGSRS